MDFDDYLKVAIKHLEAKTNSWDNNYKEVNDSVLNEAKAKITNMVREAFNNEIISKDEYAAMLPPEDDTPVPGRFYCTFKVHKDHEHGENPPTQRHFQMF